MIGEECRDPLEYGIVLKGHDFQIDTKFYLSGGGLFDQRVDCEVLSRDHAFC
jgi:hypothetical protein